MVVQDGAEACLERREVIADILASLQEADVEQAFKIILDRAGRYLAISRILVFEDYPNRRQAEAVYEWCRAGVASLIAERPYVATYIPSILAREADLPRGSAVAFDYDEAAPDVTDLLARQRLRALAFVTLFAEGRRYGCLRMDECDAARRWSQADKRFIEIIGRLVSLALLRRRGVEAADDHRRNLEALLGELPACVYVSDTATGEVVFTNRSYRRELGSEVKDRERQLLHQVIGERLQKLSPTALDQEGQPVYNFEVELPDTGRCYQVRTHLLSWTNGQMMRLVFCEDISERRQQEAYIERVAYIDHLTGLPNRYRCDMDMQEMLETTRRTGGRGYILVLDMDDFKIINDGYGHDYGDALLVEFGSFLRHSSMPGDGVFRLGGDEFALLIAPENARYLKERLDALMRRPHRPWMVIDKYFYCTISVGVVSFPDSGMSAREIMRNADVAMYEAKRAGKNSYMFYTEDMRNDSIARTEMENMLRHAIARDFEGMSVHYQPIVDIVTGGIVGAEALLRWRAPNGQMQMPDSFINLAEYLGLIGPIGEFVLERALDLLGRINRAGRPSFYISVNLSVRQIQQPGIVERLGHIVEAAGMNPSNLVFEITEGMEIKSPQLARFVLEELHKKGIRIAMDDFGTGYSSLSLLRDLPIQIIKIDRTFISSIDTSDYARSFITYLTAFAHAMDKRICLEGVETDAQLKVCRDVGADLVQGYYYHRPMPEAELLALLTEVEKPAILKLD